MKKERPQAPMPEGEPDFHELVRHVQRMEICQRELFAWQADVSRAIILLKVRFDKDEMRDKGLQDEIHQLALRLETLEKHVLKLGLEHL